MTNEISILFYFKFFLVFLQGRPLIISIYFPRGLFKALKEGSKALKGSNSLQQFSLIALLCNPNRYFSSYYSSFL